MGPVAGRWCAPLGDDRHDRRGPDAVDAVAVLLPDRRPVLGDRATSRPGSPCSCSARARRSSPCCPTTSGGAGHGETVPPSTTCRPRRRCGPSSSAPAAVLVVNGFVLGPVAARARARRSSLRGLVGVFGRVTPTRVGRAPAIPRSARRQRIRQRRARIQSSAWRQRASACSRVGRWRGRPRPDRSRGTSRRPAWRGAPRSASATSSSPMWPSASITKQ